MDYIVEFIAGCLMVFGSIFVLIGAFGLYRFPDFFMRLHGPTKATTLGVGSILLSSIVFFSYHDMTVSLHELLVILFLFATAPVSAHMLSKVGEHQKLPLFYKTRGNYELHLQTEGNESAK